MARINQLLGYVHNKWSYTTNALYLDKHKVHNILMPSKYAIKEFVEDGVYHVYNRGVEKRDIFLDDQDYAMFLFLLRQYLLDPAILKQAPLGTDPSRIERKNFNKRIDLLGYCLMPNHFHLILQQQSSGDMSQFMKCLATNYAMHFNYKYKRSGVLFQGRYKAILVDNDSHLLQLSRYIHRNPIELLGTYPNNRLTDYAYSSYQEYLGLRNTKWVNPDFVISVLASSDNKNSLRIQYKKFAEHNGSDDENILGNLILE